MRRLYVLSGLIVLVAMLHYAFPYVLLNENARLHVLYLVVLLSLMTAGSAAAWKKQPGSRRLRDAGIWAVILTALLFAYGFHDDVLRSRFLAELMPSRVRAEEGGTLSIRASEGGHFFVDGDANGVRMHFLIDTGASDIVLSPDDAARAGIAVDTLDYAQFSMTANGTGRSADAVLRSLTVGTIALEHVRVSVNKAWMPESLLGMRFLRRLKGFRVEGDRLILMP